MSEVPPSSTAEAEAGSGRCGPEGAILDCRLLSDLDRRLGKDQMRMFAGLFDKRLTTAMAIVTDDADAQRRALEAHSLISLAGNLGCTELMAVSRALSEALRHGGGDIAALVADLVAAASRARTALTERYAP